MLWTQILQRSRSVATDFCKLHSPTSWLVRWWCVFVEFSVVKPNGDSCWLCLRTDMSWNLKTVLEKRKPRTLYWLTEARSLTVTVQTWNTRVQGRQCSRDPSHCLQYRKVSAVTSLSCDKYIPTLYLIMLSVCNTD